LGGSLTIQQQKRRTKMNVQAQQGSTLAEIEAAFATMEAEVRSTTKQTTISDLLEEQQELLDSKHEASKLADTAEGAARLAILDTDLENLSAKIAEFSDNTNDLMNDLDGTFEKMGYVIHEAKNVSPEDQQLVTRAKDHLASLNLKDPGSAASEKRVALVAAIETAKGKWFNSDGVAGAEQALVVFDETHPASVEEAGKALIEIEAEAERNRVARLRTLPMDEQVGRMIKIGQQLHTKIGDDIKNTVVAITNTRKSLDESLTAKEAASKAADDLTVKIVAAEEVVTRLTLEVESATTDSVRSTAEKKLGTANDKLAELNGNKHTIQQTANGHAEAAVIHEKTLLTLQTQRSNLQAHAEKLMINLKTSFVQAKASVEIIKNSVEERAAGRIHKAGSEHRRKSLVLAVQSYMASERGRLEMNQDHKKAMTDFAEITEVLAQGQAETAIADAVFAKEKANEFGIDRQRSNWLRIAEEIMAEEEKAAA
jgi:hypothetical protein